MASIPPEGWPRARGDERIDYLCFNAVCLGIGRWSVLVDRDGDPLDEQDAQCPACGERGEPDA